MAKERVNIGGQSVSREKAENIAARFVNRQEHGRSGPHFRPYGAKRGK